MQGWRDLTVARVVKMFPLVVVASIALEFISGGGGPDAAVPAAVIWQTVIIHLVGFGAALWTIQLLYQWTADAGGMPTPGAPWVGSAAVAATVVSYGVVDAVQMVVKSAIPGPPTSSTLGPGAQFPSAVKNLVTTSLYEEATFAAIPAATAGCVIAVLAHHGRTTARVRVAVIVAFVVAGGILRGAIHWYQGLVPATIAAAWGAATVLIYWRWQSILGLVVVHSWYNSTTLLPDDHWVLYAVISWLLVVGAAGWVCHRGRRAWT